MFFELDAVKHFGEKYREKSTSCHNNGSVMKNDVF